ncbi:kinase-like domain-containing protein [Rhizophagus diaphanus]|nr:kinase-like domain-containing protein [Rhizophagus diaphanus] [Rhizophagus sp. MUCL 43196]
MKIGIQLYNRAKLAEFVIDQLIRRRKENIKNFKNFSWYKSFERLIEILTKIKIFVEKISQLHEIKKFSKVKNIKERFDILINEYDNVMMDLNFTMAITNEQQRKIDHENLKDNLSEIIEFLDSVENKLKTSIIYEEVLNIRPNNKNVKVKNLDDIKLTKLRIIKDDDIRGRFIRKMYLNTNEVACIKAYNYESLPYYHNLATYVNIYLRDGITLKLKLAYTLDVCRAIAYLNALGIYHKELQCSNVLVTAENIAKLKFSSPIRSLSSTFEDVRWRAPEMILNMKLYDQKCEIYSIGMLLWELIFERRPYEDIDFSMMIDYVTNGGREKLQFDNNSSIMVNIQKSIKKIIKKAWSHDPGARMSISKLFIDLDTLIKSLDEDNNKVDNKMSLKLKNPSNYKIEVYKYDSKSIQNEIEPILSIDIGIKAHKAKKL